MSESASCAGPGDCQPAFGAENLDWLTSHIAVASIPEQQAALRDVNAFLAAIYNSEEYVHFLSHGQFVVDDASSSRFTVPSWVIDRNTSAYALLSDPRCRVVAGDGSLQVKIDRHFAAVHLTDGYWTPASVRVFSNTDESEHICNYIRSECLDRSHPILLDPACGSGTHALGSRFEHVVCLDVSVRAISYARLNAALNGSSGWLVGLNDIRAGLPGTLGALRGGVLYAANMPFALMPDPIGGAAGLQHVPAQDGGHHGISLTLAALSALQTLWQCSTAIPRIAAAVVFYSLGRSEHGPWEIEMIADSLFPEARKSVSLLKQDRMWRVNGNKIAANPMPLSQMEAKADCRMTWTQSEAPAVRAGYHNLAGQLVQEGWSHLGYGLLTLRLER